MDTFHTMADEELVVMYVNGNNEAFDELLARHQHSLYSYILYTVRDNGLAEDIFQDTFMKAIITIQQGKYIESGKFKAWINRIARNLIIDYFRQKKSENTVSNDAYEVDLFNNPSLCEDTVETKMVRTQVLNDVRMLVDCLPDNQKEVVEMRYYKNLSFKEIAEVTGVSINTALGRMRYAILNMRKMATEYQIVLTIN
jgi:RNA polymerase sigma-70 factor (ECF subfamily)